MSEPKKILLVTRPIAPPWDEASKNFAFSLAKDLGPVEKLQFHLLTKGSVSELPSSVVQEQIYTHSQNDFGLSQKLRLFWFLARNASKFDIIHLLFTPTKSNVWLIKLALKAAPKATIIQTVATLREDIFSDAELKQLMFSDLIITYSDYAKNKLEKLGLKKVRRIYPGIDLEKYQPRETRSSHKEYSLEDFVINFTGEYIRLGAMDDVVEAFIAVAKEIPNAKLSMAVRVKNGQDAQKKKEIVEKLKQNNLLEKVVFHDDGKFNMADIYNLCDVSLFPVQNMRGKFDVPLVVVEAMACAKSVIISDLPILQEFANPKNSVIIERGNVGQIKEAALDLYAHPEKRMNLGKSARQFVEANFDIRKVAQKYQEIYETL